MEKNLSIVHPCYNPKMGWEIKFVENYLEFICQLSPTYEIQLVLVNDGSTSGITNDHIHYIRSRVPNFLYIHNKLNSGKGFALRSAMKKITKGYIIYTDVDSPYNLKNTLEMFSMLRSNECDVVVGVRTFSYFRQLPLSRLFCSVSLLIANALFFPSLFIKDTQSGLKGFNQKGKDIFMKTKINGFLFDAEFIRLCSKEKLRISKISLCLNKGISFTRLQTKVIKEEIQNFIRLLEWS